MTSKFLKKHLDFVVNEHGEMPALKLSTLNPAVEFEACAYLKTRTVDELRAMDHGENDEVVAIAREFMIENGIGATSVRVGTVGGNRVKLTISHFGELCIKPKRLERLVKRHIIDELPNRLSNNREMSGTELMITKRHYTKNVEVVFVQNDYQNKMEK